MPKILVTEGPASWQWRRCWWRWYYVYLDVPSSLIADITI